MDLGSEEYSRTKGRPICGEKGSSSIAGGYYTLEKRVQHYVGLKEASNDGMSVKWFYNGAELLRIRTASDFISFLSELSDDLYEKAPTVHNELVNRRILSSAAAAARMRLIERMLTHSDLALLGMDPTKKPPEMSIYLSVLAQSKIHRRQWPYWVSRRRSRPKTHVDFCQRWRR